MLKSELIETITHHLPNLSLEDSAKSVNLILELMTKSLCQGERIEIRGFGSFTLRFRNPRNAHNPKTGQRVQTTGKHRPHFKPGKEMRERVNKSLLEQT